MNRDQVASLPFREELETAKRCFEQETGEKIDKVVNYVTHLTAWWNQSGVYVWEYGYKTQQGRMWYFQEYNEEPKIFRDNAHRHAYNKSLTDLKTWTWKFNHNEVLMDMG